MIGKAAAAVGRRGIIRGAIGLGAALGFQQGSGARVMPRWLGPSTGFGLAQGDAKPEPDWLQDLGFQTQRDINALHSRPSFDAMDLDIAMLRSPSPAWKIVAQRQRDEARKRAADTIWEHLTRKRDAWMKGLLP